MKVISDESQLVATVDITYLNNLIKQITRRLFESAVAIPGTKQAMMETEEEQDTETKLAILSSIFTGASQDSLFDTLIRAEGDIPRAIDLHLDSAPPAKRQKLSTPSPQKSILKWTAAAEPPRKVSSPPAYDSD
jgi:hypothetical protein